MPTLLPPPQYDVPPPMRVIEFVLPQSEVQRICEERIARNPPGFLARDMRNTTKLLLLARDLRVRAEEVLAQAETYRNAEAQQIMRGIAASYEQVATRLERASEGAYDA